GAPSGGVPPNVRGFASSGGKTNLPGAPPSKPAGSFPLPATPPASSISSRKVVPMATSYTPGCAMCPQRQNSLVPDESSVPVAANVAPPSRRIQGTLASVSTLLTAVGWRQSPAWVGKGGLLRGSPR